MKLQLQWWEYFVIALSFFIGCIFLNFLVKKFNEAKLEERLSRLQQKTSTNRSTQALEPSTMEPLTSTTDQLSFKGISFVYNKEDNLKSKEKDSSNSSSIDSSKQNSKLKFLGKIYDDIKLSSKESHEKHQTNDDNNKFQTVKIKPNQLSENYFPRHQQNAYNNVELETWISELLLNYVMTNWRSL